MQNAEGTLRNFGETARRSIATIRNWSLAISAAGSAVALAFRKINDETLKTAGYIDDLNAKTGISRQTLQELGYAAQQSGIAVETLGDGLTRMTRRTAEAAAGNEAYAASYRRLGIEILNADGTIRDTSDLFLELVERLNELPDVGERSRIAFNLLGDSGYALMPMLSMGREEIERYMQEANELSAVLSDRTIAAYAKYDQTMTRFRTTMRGVRNELAAASIPIFSELAQRAEAGGRAVVAWIQENQEFISQLIIMGGILTTLALGIGLVTTGFTIAGRVIGVVSAILGFLLSPMGLVIAGLVTLYLAWSQNWGDIRTITENTVNAIRKQWDRLVEWWEESTIGQTIRDWWGKVVDVWNSEELTLPQKVVEIAKLVPGVGWVIGFVQDIAGIWRDEELSFGEKTVEIVRLIPGLGWLANFIESVQKIWADEDLTLREKVVAIARLIPGVKWIENFSSDVKEIWHNEELTFGEKIVEIVRLLPGVKWLENFVAEVKRIWNDESLTLPEKAVEIVRLIPGVTAIENMIKELREVWSNQELTLGEKVVETFKVITDTIEVEGGSLAFLFGAAVTAPIVLRALSDAIRMIPGLIALSVGGNYLRLGLAGLTLALIIYHWQFWNADPQARENMLQEANKIIDGIFPEGIAVPAKAALRFTVEVGGRMFDAIKKGMDEGDWSDVFGAAADVWRAGASIWVTLQLAKETATALLGAIQKALGLAAASQGLGMPAVIGVMSVGIALVTAMKEEDWSAFAADLLAALLAAGATIGLTGNIKAGVLVFTAVFSLEIGSTFWDAITGDPPWQAERRQVEHQLEADFERVIEGQRQGAENGADARVAQLEALMEEWRALNEDIKRLEKTMMYATPEVSFVVARQLQELTDRRDEIEAQIAALTTELEATKTAMQQGDGLATFLLELEKMSGQSGLAAVLAALYRTEGGAEARVPFGMTDFADAGNQFGKAENREKFRHLLSLVDVEEGTAEFYAAAAAISVEHYWNTFLQRFPEVANKTLADLSPDIARLFIEHMGSGFAPLEAHPDNKNWIPNMIQILGVHEGGESVMRAWAEGLAAGGEDAKRVIEEITKWVADRTIGHSPPPEGPLSDIDDPKVGETWLRAIAREIEEEGGTLEAAIKVVADRMWNSMMGFLEARWPGAAEFLKGLMGAEWDPSDAIDDITTQVNDLKQQIKDLNNQSIQWTENLVKGISDAIAYGRDLSSVFQNFLSMIASQFLQTRVFGPLLNAWLPGVLSGLPVFHSGGLILGGAGAMVMHNGGIVPGLAPDERLIIGQVGERVLSRRQNDRFEEMLERQSNEPQEVIHYYHINAVDAKSFADLVARNPEAITSVTIKDIGSNGPIRKAIQAVSRGG